MKSGSTKVYTVIGNPITHSKSPNMHNAAFQKLNIDACYVPLAPNTSEVKNICDLIRTGVISGSNVTIPYKEEVMKYVDILSDEAKLIGSVNTLYSKENLFSIIINSYKLISKVENKGAVPPGI